MKLQTRPTADKHKHEEEVEEEVKTILLFSGRAPTVPPKYMKNVRFTGFRTHSPLGLVTTYEPWRTAGFRRVWTSWPRGTVAAPVALVIVASVATVSYISTSTVVFLPSETDVDSFTAGRVK